MTHPARANASANDDRTLAGVCLYSVKHTGRRPSPHSHEKAGEIRATPTGGRQEFA